MSEELKYAPALEKLGLEPFEFKDLLTSKMKKLFKKPEDLPNTSIEQATKCFCIRANIINPEKIDKRRSIANRFRLCIPFKRFRLPHSEESPRYRQEKRSRRQGGTNPSKSDHNEYHLQQAELFQELQEQEKLHSLWDDNGYLLEDGNDERCSIVSMCNKLDSITREYIEEYLEELNNHGKRRRQDRKVANRNSEFLEKLFLPCITIIIGRMSVDWATANDIMSKDGYKQWKEHVWALMTFAALSVVIDALSICPFYFILT
ncbi:uncharacterized protein LOC116289895 [Actinia tenebrosa]|uniref:Uncharacterized protein LOC116289895 n=1 Tax=Actinia tenebrosa TaxID=6105 RepID=A0A6P8HJC2_ACTTE|nr:uncharacterized protein LOC116289895 [Actinia tenebrosa]